MIEVIITILIIKNNKQFQFERYIFIVQVWYMQIVILSDHHIINKTDLFSVLTE